MAQVIFSRKTTSEINELPIVDGQLIWNIETGETYIDIGTERIATGGSGNDGKSAYEIWLEQGNIGTEQEFLDSLKASGTGEGSCLLTEQTITIGESEEGDITVSVTGLELDYTSVELEVGQGMQLACSVIPSNATNNAIAWSSSDSTKVKVEEGYITALASGNATITAKSVENSSIKASCSVAVTGTETGGDTGDNETAGGATREKVYLYDLTPVKEGLILKKDGKTEFAVADGNYYSIPYSEGMNITTRMNPAWVTNYPPIIVDDGGIITKPETTMPETMIYNATLSGFSENAKVYINTYQISATSMYKEKAYYIVGGVE